MNSKKSKIKIKTKIRTATRRWKYLKDSHSDISELFEIYDLELSSILADLCSYEDFIKKTKREPEAADSVEEGSVHFFEEEAESENHEEFLEDLDEKSDNPAWAKKLYKKIALQTHPDKLSKLDLEKEELEKREELFKKAADSLKNKNYSELLSLADELNLELDLEDDEYLETINEAIKKFSSEIEETQRKNAWVWGEMENVPEIKTNFIVRLFDSLPGDAPPRNVIQDYLEHYEKETVDIWKQKYLQNKRARYRLSRKEGQRPPPSIATERRKKC